MPYDPKDLRSQLTATRADARAAGACFAPQYFEFLKLEPDDVSALGSQTWLARSQNCCVAFSLVEAGDTLVAIAQRFYGDGGRYGEIYDANRERLKAPADLREGLLLEIP